MSKIYFMNNGDFDVRAMLTMGLSAKSEDAIGFFGTGFKYAVSIILRLGGTIRISTVSGIYEFESRRENVRGKDFDIVYMNGREAGFTTHLGANWEPWMAYRELYCNARDEKGAISTELNSDYDTIVEVSCHEIAKCHESRRDYFITSKPLATHDSVEIHEGGKPFIYYRGIAVRNAFERQIYSYNIKSPVTLTEDRTAKHDHEVVWPIRKGLQALTDRPMLRKVLRHGEHGEAAIGFDSDWTTSDEFFDVCHELMKTDAGVCNSARLLAKQRQAAAGDWPEFKLNDVQNMMLERSISFLAKMDININMFPIKTVTGLGDGVMGRALDGVIYLSEQPFIMGTKQVASTLIEEWVHSKTGCQDFDRQMQNWLFDKILSVGEQLNGEPL